MNSSTTMLFLLLWAAGGAQANATDNCYKLEKNTEKKLQMCIKVNNEKTKKGWEKAEIILKSQKPHEFFIRTSSYILVKNSIDKGIKQSRFVFLDSREGESFSDRLNRFLFSNANPIEVTGVWDPVTQVEKGKVKFGKDNKDNIYSFTRKWRAPRAKGIAQAARK